MAALSTTHHLFFLFTLLFSAVPRLYALDLAFFLQHDNSRPLRPDGSDYPCGQSLVQDTTAREVLVGERLNNITDLISVGKLSSKTSGSCQISITLDNTPTKNSVFKVLKTIASGCPLARPDDTLPASYSFKIPRNFPSMAGAVIALTWFPTDDNSFPTMHMECIHVQFQGAKEPATNTAAFDSLPNMFVANIGNRCSTGDNTNLVNFPEKGGQWESGNDPDPNANIFTPWGPGCPTPTVTTASYSTSSQTSSSMEIITSSGQTTTASSAQLSHPLPTYYIIGQHRSAIKTGKCSSDDEFHCLKGGITFQTCVKGTWSEEVQHLAPGQTCSVRQKL
ncbi:hypothetical protein QBC38DRAFT_361402 [Podospora fimiseda]|uniref:Glycoside Hydrolase Family 61 n=1 Tax=Podospora fimiseda TaxID=252190 RepID=A0AAN7BSE1_9PEZI|nr:hypothetical protein QBC38DRAFT_361402 [Podospora fimiseda]